MRSCSHSVWCKCRRGDGGSHHNYPTKPVESYEELCAYCDKIGCEMKTYEEMCSWAHYDSGVAMGGRFKGFTCSCCGYSPSEKQWRADVAKWHAMTDEEQAAAREIHFDVGDELNSSQQHYDQEPFMPPMPKHGMERCGVDNLHLTFLNLFKHLFKYTVHEGLPNSKKILVAEYLKAAHFYSYDAASKDEDPVSHWIGRKVKRFLSEADKHLPFLLHVAAAPVDSIPETAAWRNDKGQQVLDDDDEYQVTPAMIAAEEKLEPLMMKDATRWDNFLSYVRLGQRAWPQGEADSDEYRKGRAVESFNAHALCANDLLELKPTMKSWVPHVGQFIAPRQMVELGDPARRQADACESFGAKLKKTIKHLTCRRHIRQGSTEHTCKARDKNWQQTFTKGYIEQAFTRATVSESLKHGPENEPYLLRRDARQTSTGKEYIYKKWQREMPQPMRSIRELVEGQEGAEVL